MSNGENDLNKLLVGMDPKLHPGEYVFATVPLDLIQDLDLRKIISLMKEEEGVSLILEKTFADDLRLKNIGVWKWISLNIHSSLDAVGLIASISNALADHNVSCNVVAGFYHDHIFVRTDQSLIAMQILKKLSSIKR